MQITRIRSKPFTTGNNEVSGTTALKTARILAENTFYRFDNYNTYIRHNTIELGVGGTVSYNILTDVENPMISNSRVFDNVSSSVYVECSLSGSMFVIGSIDAYLDGVKIVSGVTTNPTAGVEHTLIVVAKEAVSIDYISSPTKPFHGFIYDVTCTGITNTDVYTSGTAFWGVHDSFNSGKTFASESDNEHTEDISDITYSGSWNESGGVYTKASYYGQLFVVTESPSDTVLLKFSVTEPVYVRSGGVVLYEDLSGNVEVMVNGVLGADVELYVGTPTVVSDLTNISLTRTTDGDVVNFVATDVYENIAGINFASDIVPLLESLHICTSGLYYGDTGTVQYRLTGDTEWLNAADMMWDNVESCLGNVIVYLEENTSYDVKVSVVRGNKVRSNIYTVTTLTTPTIGNTYNLSDIYTSGILDIPALITAGTIVAGTEESYTKILDDGSTPITTRLTDQSGALYLGSASYMYLEGITVEGGIPNGIYGLGAHHIWIDGCDISGFGRDVSTVTDGYSYDSEGELINYDSGILLEDGYMIVVQNSSVHSPIPNANSWTYGHPAGPNAFLSDYTGITDDSAGRIIIRNNTFYGTDTHRFNDVIECKTNGSVSGGFVKNSAIYNNTLSYSNDDIIELDGGMFNVAFYDNDCSHAYSGVSAIPCKRGPCFVFNNYIHDMGDEDGSKYFGFKVGGTPEGVVNIINNLAKLEANNGVSDAGFNYAYIPYINVIGNIIICNESGYFSIKDPYHYVENKFKDNYIYTIADETSNFDARITSHFNDPSLVNTEYAQSIWDDSNTWFSIKMVEGIVPNISRLDGNNTLIGKL